MNVFSLLTVLLLLFISSFITSCSEEVSISNENVLQINDVGLREGVFVRRYQLTNEYKKDRVFTPEILKTFIEEKLEPDYLFVAHARDLGFQNDNSFQQSIKDYRVDLIAGVHPLYIENLKISEKELKDFYKQKSVIYDVDLVLANSFSMADSMYRFLLSGNKVTDPNKEGGPVFPKLTQLKNVSYGDGLHPELMPKLTELKEGQTCRPVFTSPIWSILRVNRKRKNTGLPSYDGLVSELNKQLHVLMKFENKKQIIEELKNKYPVSVNKEFFPTMVSSFLLENHRGRIDKNKIQASDLDATFLEINHDKISLSSFISSFNKGVQFMQIRVIKQRDLEMLVDEYIVENLLYLDALQKGAEQNVMIKDKLVNKENKLLLTIYLNKEIGQKVTVSDTDARQYYENNRDKWSGEYKDVEKSVKFELRNDRLNDRRNDLIDELRKKYQVRYNETLLKKIATELTEEKSTKAKT